MPLICNRRQSKPVAIGGVVMGGDHPVVVQSMTNTDTEDAVRTANQVADLARAGSEIVRITVNTEAAARACLLYTSPSPRDATLSRMPSSA